MFANEVWVNLYVKGPQPEIDRLRELCAIIDIDGYTDEDVVDFSALMPESTLGQPYGTYNLVSRGPHDPETLNFGFDISAVCPEEIFERLADEFPTLVFTISCIGSMDEFRAEGLYNDPPGSKKLEYFEVPDDYWG